VRLLRAYLDYAERGVEALPGAITGAGDRDFDSPFEQEVFDELTRRGLTVHPQVGCSGFRIDLAVADSHSPGRYLLGVECDGASYHASATARDRDRLRQEVLENLGWHICRVWSTDWLRDRDTQVKRVKAALEIAQREGDAPRHPPEKRRPPAPPSGKTLVVEEAPNASKYRTIDDVPDDVLRETVCNSLRSLGATEPGEFITFMARQFGFARTGSRIQARIEEMLETLIREGEVCRTADGRVQRAPCAANP
jgi:very-short-patch-repair endonuclease